MKTFKLLSLIAIIVITSAVVSAFKLSRKAKNNPPAGFALVELFTSEGCSSCPPADELVARVLKEDAHKPVYILAYHVDYWNHLGWRDEFSSAQYADRQRQYAKWLKLEGVYTPQIVVNGKTEFVGSNEAALHNAIKAGLTGNDSGLTITAVNNNGKFTVSYQAAAGNMAHASLFVAFVQKAAQTHVKGGENGGRVLNHINIVKQLNTIDIKTPDGKFTITAPKGYSPQTWDVTGFLQNTLTGQVLSAQKIVS